MTRDYAARSDRRATRAPARRRREQPAGSAGVRGVSWSAPSFSVGAIFGAAAVLLASYAPSALEDATESVQVSAEPATAPVIEFSFDEKLENDRVVVDTSAYPARFPDEDPAAARVEYMIQAASLREQDAATALRSNLENLGLDSRSERVDMESGTWYRVMVGPFGTRTDADRALTLLRQQNLSARIIKHG